MPHAVVSQTVDLLDLEPVFTGRGEPALVQEHESHVSFENQQGQGSAVQPVSPMPLQKLLSAEASQSSPFTARHVSMHHVASETIAPPSPRTPKLGSSTYQVCTPGGTRVLDGPPPPTPPYGNNSYPFRILHVLSRSLLGHHMRWSIGVTLESPKSEEPSRLVLSLPALHVTEGGSDAG